MAEQRDVVITGMGLVTPIGIGKDEFWDSLCQRSSGVRQRVVDGETDERFRVVAELPAFEPKQYVKPRKALKVMCREIQFAAAGAQMAMDDASLEAGSFAPDRIGVVLGAEIFYCELSDLEEVYRNCLAGGQFDYDRWGKQAMSDIYPLWMLKHLPNMAACHIGIAYDCRGPNNTIVAEECSSLNAIVEAYHVIARGHADIMIAGGTGSRITTSGIVHRGLCHLSRRYKEPQAASRPFDKMRDGMVLGEGAGIFVMESRQHAEARGASIQASILGYGQSCGVNTNGNASAFISNSISMALRNAGLEPGDIGHVNADGKSTVQDDRIEAAAIRGMLGDVPVTAPKSYFGFLGAGGGSVELAASALAIQKGEVPVTLNYTQPDEECPVNVIHDQPLPASKRTAISLSQSRTGQASALVVGAPELKK